ncbi:hypothetical protein [Candidatus Endomicrobiellum trichonymphae]|uniref:hypothetical protein n=1 Tax=Endomicrobium trichonymphae TaxID=1408204 RepID=UPI000865458E|nr:hypothetical protein [Candidatus Endomicrobium trichonymphae]BAV59318.1 hypothetical protein RSTT_P3-003 [Candidatus Endomicrobium trichonymphae]
MKSQLNITSKEKDKEPLKNCYKCDVKRVCTDSPYYAPVDYQLDLFDNNNILPVKSCVH